MRERGGEVRTGKMREKGRFREKEKGRMRGGEKEKEVSRGRMRERGVSKAHLSQNKSKRSLARKLLPKRGERFFYGLST